MMNQAQKKELAMVDMTVKEAAKYLNVKPVTVYSNIRNCKLIAWKRGSIVLMDKKEVERWDKIRKR